MDGARQSIRTLQGQIMATQTGGGTTTDRLTGSFIFTRDGSYRVVDTTTATVSTYDATTRTSRYWHEENGVPMFGAVAHDATPSSPFESATGDTQSLALGTAAYVRAVIAGGDPNRLVHTLVYEGRPAWEFDEVTSPATGTRPAERVRFIIDQATGFPLLSEDLTGATIDYGVHVQGLIVNAGVPAGSFSLTPAQEIHLVRSNVGFRTTGIAAAARLGAQVVGPLPPKPPSHITNPGLPVQLSAVRPLAPTWTPAGYRLESVLSRLTRSRGYGAGPERPVDLSIVATYRRGFDTFWVETDWQPYAYPASRDPLAFGMLPGPPHTTVALASGALRGVRVNVVISPAFWPHLWGCFGEAKRETVSVAGDLTRQELLRVAGSLQAYTK